MQPNALHKKFLRFAVFGKAGEWWHCFAKVNAGARVPARPVPDVAGNFAWQVQPDRVSRVHHNNLPEAILYAFAKGIVLQSRSLWLLGYLHIQGIALQGNYLILPIAAGSCHKQAGTYCPNHFFLKAHCKRKATGFGQSCLLKQKWKRLFFITWVLLTLPHFSLF